MSTESNSPKASKPTLKPCPFCGQDKASIKSDWDADNIEWKHVECFGCGARTRGDWFSQGNDCPIFYEQIRDAWNKRPNEDLEGKAVPPRVVAEMKFCLDQVLHQLDCHGDEFCRLIRCGACICKKNILDTLAKLEAE